MKQITHIHEILPFAFNSIVTSPNGDVLQKQLVKGDSNTYKVIYNDDVTVVIFSDGSKGVAKRNPSDRYNRQIGHDIAHARAKIKKLENEIKKLSKTQHVEERRIEISK
jgi:hypothetical protein